jgi:hypothetical protein
MKKHGLIAAALLGLIVLSAIFYEPRVQTTPAATPQPIISRSIPIQSMSDGFYIVAAGQKAQDELAMLQSDLPPETEEIRLSFVTTIADRLGRERITELFTLAFPADDVRRANFENLDGPETLDLATWYRPDSVTGAAIVERPCNSPEGGVSGHICELRMTIPPADQPSLSSSGRRLTGEPATPPASR